jgi:hypothetical protein
MRQYIGISNQGPTVFYNVRMDVTGEPMFLVDEDAVSTLRVNFGDWLNTGETISTATIVTESCTASISTATPNVDITISAATSHGKITLKATASSGDVWRGIICVRRTERYGDEQRRRDYT